MCQNIPETGDRPPRNLWRTGRQFGRQFFDRLADDLEPARDAIDPQLVLTKPVEIESGDVRLNRLSRLDDVLQKQVWLTRQG